MMLRDPASGCHLPSEIVIGDSSQSGQQCVDKSDYAKNQKQ